MENRSNESTVEQEMLLAKIFGDLDIGNLEVMISGHDRIYLWQDIAELWICKLCERPPYIASALY